MTFLPVIRNKRGIEIGLAKHILWSLGLFLCMALQEKLIKPSVMLCLPQSIQDVKLFFCGPVMLTARLENCQLCVGMAERCRTWRTDHRHRRCSCCCWHLVKYELDLSPVLVHTQLEQSESRLAVPGTEVCSVLCY